MDFNNASNAYARGFDSNLWTPMGMPDGIESNAAKQRLFGDHAAAQGLEMTFAGDRLAEWANVANAKASLEAYEERAAKAGGGASSSSGGGGGIVGKLAGTAGAAIGTAIGGPIGGTIGGGLGNIVGGLFG